MLWNLNLKSRTSFFLLHAFSWYMKPHFGTWQFCLWFVFITNNDLMFMGRGTTSWCIVCITQYFGCFATHMPINVYTENSSKAINLYILMSNFNLSFAGKIDPVSKKWQSSVQWPVTLDTIIAVRDCTIQNWSIVSPCKLIDFRCIDYTIGLKALINHCGW